MLHLLNISMTLLSFLSVVLLQVDSWHWLFNLFTWHWICKLLAKINVTVVVVTGEVNACEWNLVLTICRHWCWGGQWLNSEVFSAPAGLVLRIQTCPKTDTTTLSVMIPGSKASSGISVTHSWQTPWSQFPLVQMNSITYRPIFLLDNDS